MGNEEQAVDFRHGTRLAERAGKLDEQMDGLDLHRVQGRRPGSAGQWRFVGKTEVHEASVTDFPFCSIKNEQNKFSGARRLI